MEALRDAMLRQTGAYAPKAAQEIVADALVAMGRDTFGAMAGGGRYLADVPARARGAGGISAADALQWGRDLAAPIDYTPSATTQSLQQAMMQALMGSKAVQSIAGSRPVQALAEFAQENPNAMAGIEMGAAPLDFLPGGGLGEAIFLGAVKRAGKLPSAHAPEAIQPKIGEAGTDFSKEYPLLGHPELGFDKTKKEYYPAKGESEESKRFMADRDRAREDIAAGNYQPYFDVGGRYDAKGNYPKRSPTIEYAKPKKPETVEKWRGIVKTPDAKQRLLDAYQTGVKSGGHDGWYKMGQLEDEFIREYGPELGPQMFRERFSDAMAATTGGADPTGNLLQATFANYKRVRGEAIPKSAYEINSPVGGRYVSGNMQTYDKVINQGQGLVGMPKRQDFSGNFEGDPNVVTVDEHMTQLVTPGKNAPPGDSYFAYEELIRETAEELGISPRELQEVAWGGRKAQLEGGYAAKPMIEIVNEAIERTARLTGVDPAEVVRKGLVRGEMPIYEMAGAGGLAAVMAAMAMNNPRESGGYQ